ncbi:MAG: tetratricopeptide repeat protein [Chthoniobacterales bacterium]
MNFSSARLLVPLFLLLVLAAPGCRRTISNEEWSAREAVRSALRKHQFAEAIAPARRVLQFAPKDNGAWARLAQAQFGQGDLRSLVDTLDQWKKTVRKPSGKYHEYRGDLAWAKHRHAEALEAWSEAVAGNDRKTRVFIKIARLEQQAGRWQEAAAAWTRGMKGQPTARALVNRAICYRHLHSWEAASADLQQAARIAPGNSFVRRQRALFDRLGKFLAEVRELDVQLATSPNDDALLADRALLFLRAGDAALALDDAEHAATLAPEAVRPRLFREIARKVLGLMTAPSAGSPVPSLDDLSSNFLQTISRLDAEISAEPKSPELLTNRAWQLNEIEQPQLALADVKLALQLDPTAAGAHAEASYALAKLKRSQEAYDEICRATELDPNFSTAWQYRGELEMKRDDDQAAVNSLTRALAINQTSSALARREECYRHLGLIAKAEDDHKLRAQLSAPH